MPKGKVYWRSGELVVAWEITKAGNTRLSQPTNVKDANIIEAMKPIVDKKEAPVEVELNSNGSAGTITFVSMEIAEKVHEKEIEDGIKKELQIQKNQENEAIEQRANTQPLKNNFHNPYNFVPAIPRDITHIELGDHKPHGHDRYVSDKFSGKLTVKMTVETPLVVLDTAQMSVNANDKTHKEFPVRVKPLLDENGNVVMDSNGQIVTVPSINPTAVKGMLRSAYEAVTNSRMSVFTKHDDRLAFRREAKSPIPVIIIKKGDEFFAKPLEYQKVDNKVMNHVAKLLRYEKTSGKIDKGESNVALKYDSGELPEHGDAVWLTYEKVKAGAEVQRIKLRKDGETRLDGWKAGWVCVTGANINGKRFERVFLDVQNAQLLPVKKELWENLIKNYQSIHEKELKNREDEKKKPTDYLGDKPNETAFSRHIYTKTEVELSNNTLCYAEIDENQVKSLFPVMISRQLFDCSPNKLLPKSLNPAKLITQLSPADRVFGWVRQGKLKDDELTAEEKEVKDIGAYRGQIRFGEVKTERTDAIQKFNDWLPMNILGQPKPQQGRFYVSENYNTGKSQIEKRNNEDAGYKHGRGLRGRKIYPHHENWTIQNNLKEYQRPDRIQDSQNRSIEGWITPQTKFTFDIHFTNLSEVELGGLVWLLSLNGENENKFFHRFGGGKPYGFGSVKLEIIESDVRNGKDLEKFYMSLDDEKIGKLKEDEIKNFGIEFKNLADSMFPTIIKSFLRACEGFSDNKPTHYPRKGKNLTADTKSFEWFVENNRIDRGTVKNGYVLQDLADDDGLPYLS